MADIGRARLVVVAGYLVIAAFTWISFMRTAPDGLANVGLLLVVFPYTLIGLLMTWFVGASEFVLIPHGAGYLTAHALFYVPGVVLTTTLLWWVMGWLRR